MSAPATTDLFWKFNTADGVTALAATESTAAHVDYFYISSAGIGSAQWRLDVYRSNFGHNFTVTGSLAECTAAAEEYRK